MKFAVIDVETLSPQYRLRPSDIITGIAMKSIDKEWIGIISPSDRRNTDHDEAELLYKAIQQLKEISPDVLAGCYLWNFDLPHLIARATELDYHYHRETNNQLRLELEQTLNKFRIIDLATCDYVVKRIAPKFQKTYLSVDEICKEITEEEPLEFPQDFHVWASAKAICGEPEHLVERLENDLRTEWAILQALLERKCLRI